MSENLRSLDQLPFNQFFFYKTLICSYETNFTNTLIDESKLLLQKYKIFDVETVNTATNVEIPGCDVMTLTILVTWLLRNGSL